MFLLKNKILSGKKRRNWDQKRIMIFAPEICILFFVCFHDILPILSCVNGVNCIEKDF